MFLKQSLYCCPMLAGGWRWRRTVRHVQYETASIQADPLFFARKALVPQQAPRRIHCVLQYETAPIQADPQRGSADPLFFSTRAVSDPSRSVLIRGSFFKEALRNSRNLDRTRSFNYNTIKRPGGLIQRIRLLDFYRGRSFSCARSTMNMQIFQNACCVLHNT